MVLLNDGEQGLQEGKDDKKRRDDGGNERPRVPEIVMHEHRPPPRPPSSAILVHSNRQWIIVILLDVRIVVELVEEFGRVLDVQPVVNCAALGQYLHVFAVVDEVVHKYGVGCDDRFVIRATLLQTYEVAKHGLRRLLDEQRRDHQHAFFVKLDVQDALRRAAGEFDPSLRQACS